MTDTKGQAREVTVTMSIARVDSAAELFGLEGDRAAMAPELALLDDLRPTRTSAQPAPPAEAPPPGSAESAKSESPVQLPAWQPRLVEGAQLSFVLAVDPSAPALCYRARGILRSDLEVEFRIVIRPTLKYALIASYATLLPSSTGEEPNTKRYSIRIQQFTLPLDVEKFLQAALQKELNDLGEGERGPHRDPFLGLSVPLVSSYKISIGEGAATFAHDCTSGRVTFSADESRLSELHPAQREFAADLSRTTGVGLRPKRGAKPHLTPQTISALHEELLPACVRLLNELPKPSWPPFNQRVVARDFVDRHCQGSGEIRDTLANLMFEGDRRPSPDWLTLRALSHLTGLTATRLRQVIRKQ